VATHISVVKFGGTSIQDAAAFTRVAKIIKRQSQSAQGGDLICEHALSWNRRGLARTEREARKTNAAGETLAVPGKTIRKSGRQSALVVIVSAMSGVTNALIESFRGAATRSTANSLALLEGHFSRHVQVAAQLIPARAAQVQQQIDRSRIEITELLASASQASSPDMRIHDAIASYGERLAANLLTMILEEQGVPAEYVDARRCVITNNEHGNAEPQLAELGQRTRAELLPLLKTKRIPVLGGFFGATTNGVTTTLGRGSSDYSATLIGAALDAREIQIWTDVDGIQTADPRLVKSTRTVPHISYEEATHLAKLGARVMHPKMIEPVVAQGIPIRILNSHAPQKRGTLISAKPASRKGGFKAIAHKVGGRSAIVGFVGHGLKINFRVEPDSVGAVVRQLHEAIFEH
jgi:aspartate kinase